MLLLFPVPCSLFPIFLLLLLAGCGVPGEPLPPLLEIPAAVTDLSAVQVGAQLRLVWSAPRLTTEGTRVRELDRMEVHGVFLAREVALTSFAGQSRLVATIRANEVSNGQTQVTYEIPLTLGQIGQRASFGVKAINRKGKDAGFSNVSSLEILDLPEPPVDLRTTLTEKAIRLSWKAASLSAFGGPAPPAGGYRIYRADSGSAQQPQEIGTADGLAYQDAAFEFGHTYQYFIRAFARQGDSTALTPPSISVNVAAKDVFPPAAPRNVRAIAVPGAIEIAWSPNPESDFAGYNVYRSVSGSPGSSFTKLNPELLLIPVFRDPNVTAATRYVYHVTAADQSGNESAPSEDVPVTAE